jgi:hypothetical protein
MGDAGALFTGICPVRHLYKTCLEGGEIYQTLEAQVRRNRDSKPNLTK